MLSRGRGHGGGDTIYPASRRRDLESPGLGEVFLEDIERGFRRIREHPDAATAVAPGIRKLVLTRFPFAIIYATPADTIRVLAIAHQRKRPYYWRSRG